MKKVCVVGDGGWGTALGLTLLGNGHDVWIWGPFPDYIEEIRRTRENRKFLAGIPLPESLHWTADRARALEGASLVVLAPPSHFAEQVFSPLRGLMPERALVVSATKGFDQASGELMSEKAARLLGVPRVAVLSGPSHAEEVARSVPTAVVVAGPDGDETRAIQTFFTSTCFRTYVSSDTVGVQIGGGVKNVIAIAVGACDGLGFGDNTKAALITRGLAEITRLGLAMGARLDTFAGLSGMGDLIVTCGSRHSRNRSVGERLGKGEGIDSIRASMEQVAEGVWNCVPVRLLAERHGVEMPISEQVYAVIHGGKECACAVRELLDRTPGEESVCA